ncbi:MAG: transferase hexapeptide repeat containing protein [Acidobacteria bacterium]|nr:transferase hexapeptide repeat containing protein [Acidobacteriota bacterium]
MFPNLREDLRRYGGPWQRLKALVLAPRVWAIVAFRFGHWVHTARSAAILRLPLKILVSLIAVFIEVATNIDLPPQAAIGPGLFLPHPGYIVVAFNVVIGRHCTLAQGVTIGHRSGGSIGSLAGPAIGDRVYIGPGAVILGPIKIGSDVLIGANAVVTRSVPDRAVVVGNPARVISMKGSFDLIKYDGMDRDGPRVAALAEGSPKTNEQTIAED